MRIIVYRSNDHTLRALLITVVGLLLSGCLSHQSIVSSAYKYNIAVEESHNQVLLLNILRASKQRPMYFTTITQLRGAQGLTSSSTSFTIPFGGDANNTYTFSPGLKFTNSPSFDVKVLDSEKFMRGIVTPVKMETVKYYLDQGWPEHFLLSLFVREIVPLEKDETGRFVRDNEKIPLVNYPGRKKEYDRFSNTLNRLIIDCKLTIEAKSTFTNIGLPLSEGDAENLQHLVSAAEQKLQVKAVKEKDAQGRKVMRYRLGKPSQYLRFTYDKKCDVKELHKGSASFTDETPEDVVEQVEGQYAARFLLRSPEAMLYYLGEIVRAQHDQSYIPYVYYPSKWQKKNLFVLKKMDALQSHGNAVISVEYDGQQYGIPRNDEERGRSMHALSLITQIFAQHKNLEDFPTTRAVEVIGQ